MEVARDAGARDAAEVQTNIESFGLDHFSVTAGEMIERVHNFQVLIVGQLGQLPDVPLGGNQQMPVVIGIQIQQRERVGAGSDDEILPSCGKLVGVVGGRTT